MPGEGESERGREGASLASRHSTRVQFAYQCRNPVLYSGKSYLLLNTDAKMMEKARFSTLIRFYSLFGFRTTKSLPSQGIRRSSHNGWQILPKTYAVLLLKAEGGCRSMGRGQWRDVGGGRRRQDATLDTGGVALR